MDIDAYLNRINYRDSRLPNAETLRALQLTHLGTVPFENLSIHANQPITLNDDALYTKIVTNKRGGFCYELNGLFGALLRELGFDVAMISAGVVNAQGTFGPEFDHMALIVTLEERWLVDVGFGDSFLEPLLLDSRSDQGQGSQAFRIVAEDPHLILMRRQEEDDWQPQYRFTLKSHRYADYELMCRYHQTSPESHFTRSRICSRATSDGRITLSDLRLIITSEQHRVERTLAGEEEYAAVLRDEFGIVI